jgi:hypothetical protein
MCGAFASKTIEEEDEEMYNWILFTEKDEQGRSYVSVSEKGLHSCCDHDSVRLRESVSHNPSSILNLRC